MSYTLPFSTPQSKNFSVVLRAPLDGSTPIDWKDRLCWIQRKKKNRTYLWPGIYYCDWGEAAQHCSNEMSTEQKIDFCVNIYESYDSPSSDGVVKLLGTSTLEILEINSKDDFCGEFWGWFPHVSTKQTKPSDFEKDCNWYLPFMKAVDQAISLVKKTNCDKMYQYGRQHLEATLVTTQENSLEPPQMDCQKKSFASHQTHPQTHIYSPVAAGYVTSPSSSRDTPPRSNKTHPRASTPTRQLFLTKRKSDGSSSRNFVNSVSKPRKTNIRRVTPSRSSSRPKRKPQNDTFTSLSTMTRSSLIYKDEHDFYVFKNLMPLLTQDLGWKYRKANNTLRTWVYERVDTDGENGGSYLDDFFYEEDEVVEYCRRHDYERRYGHLLVDEEDSCVTPSPQSKRLREQISNFSDVVDTREKH